MKKCIVCGKIIALKDKFVCKDCLEFFLWKYKKDFAKHIIKFKEFEKERFESSSIKRRRYKK